MTKVHSEILLVGHNLPADKQLLRELIQKQYNLSYISNKNFLLKESEIKQFNVDLFSKEERTIFFKENHFEQMIMLPWSVTAETIHSEIHMHSMVAYIDILQLFQKSGGKRFLCFETVFERNKNNFFNEKESLFHVCQQSFFQLAETFCKLNDLSFQKTNFLYQG